MNKIKVLLVDDSAVVRQVLTRIINSHPKMEVCAAAQDPIFAMHHMNKHWPDVIILDVEMPRMDGFELATHMRNDDRLRHVPVIMITSRSGDKHRERARQIGVKHYLGKPYQENDLLATIDQIIRVAPESSALYRDDAYTGIKP